MADQDAIKDGAEVVPLRPGIELTDEQRLLHSREPNPRCFHGPYDLDVEAQRAYCRQCKREVPLFEVLEHIARESERYIAHRKELRLMASRARDELAEVEREVANAKARRRRLRAHGATVDRDDLMDRRRRAREKFPRGTLLTLYASDEETAFEVNAQLRLGASSLKIDPLLGPQCWRVGPPGEGEDVADV